MNIRCNFLFIALVFSINCFATNKIIYFISPPRSLSVAFLRMIETRGDFAIFHEPSQYTFNLAYSPGLVQEWYKPGSFNSYEQVKNAILDTAQSQNVFVKEMSFAVRDFHLNDTELMQNPEVYFVFMVRNPHHTAISMYKKLTTVFDTVAYQFPYLLGYKDLYDIFTRVKNNAVNTPYIISTEDLYTNPEKTIQQFCAHVDIAYKPDALVWDDLGDQFTGNNWHETKHTELIHHWHGDAIRSSGFGKPTPYEVDANGNPTFNEIQNTAHRELVRSVYLEHMPYYETLMREVRSFSSKDGKQAKLASSFSFLIQAATANL